jgi:hypothetical protein
VTRGSAGRPTVGRMPEFPAQSPRRRPAPGRGPSRSPRPSPRDGQPDPGRGPPTLPFGGPPALPRRRSAADERPRPRLSRLATQRGRQDPADQWLAAAGSGEPRGQCSPLTLRDRRPGRQGRASPPCWTPARSPSGRLATVQIGVFCAAHAPRTGPACWPGSGDIPIRTCMGPSDHTSQRPRRGGPSRSVAEDDQDGRADTRRQAENGFRRHRAAPAFSATRGAFVLPWRLAFGVSAETQRSAAGSRTAGTSSGRRSRPSQSQSVFPW